MVAAPRTMKSQPPGAIKVLPSSVAFGVSAVSFSAGVASGALRDEQPNDSIKIAKTKQYGQRIYRPLARVFHARLHGHFAFFFCNDSAHRKPTKSRASSGG